MDQFIDKEDNIDSVLNELDVPKNIDDVGKVIVPSAKALVDMEESSDEDDVIDFDLDDKM